MSFMENFEKELNGMRASEGKSAVKVSSGSKSSSKSTTKKKKKNGFMDNFYEELSSIADDDIGPVYDRARNRMTVKGDAEEDDGKLDFFQKGLFEDGYQAGDITKTILGTAGDAALGVVKGVGSLVEGVVDLGQYGVAGVADLLGKEEAAKDWKESAKWNLVDSVTKDASDYLDKYSVLGRTSEAILQGVGQVGGIVATGGLGAAAGLGTAGTTALTTGVMGLSGMGSGMGEAYQGGATDEEAVTYGLISGAADALTEMMFGGMGKAVNAIGLSRGLSSADDMLAKAVSKKFTNQIAKNFAEFGVKASAEGLEEVVAGVAQAMGKKLTYMSEKDMKDILEDENLLEQFIVGSATSGMIQSGIIPGTKKGSLIEANQNESDFLTGTTKNEQAVIRKEVENRVAAEEQSGKKLTKKEKAAIEEQVARDLEKGYISTDTIEEVLGGSTYDIYKGTVDSEDAILREYEELGQKTNATLKDQARYTELTQKVKDIREKSQRDALKTQLGEEVFNLVKGDRLIESYNERARRGQAFQADLTKYDAKQQAVIQKAIDSGILNNTNRTHEFVDLVSKISADKGVLFDFTNNQKLKDSGFAVEGKQVNGYVTKDGITLNIDSKKALETTVGHEITHVLEGTEVYDALKQTIFDYAKARGEYQGRYDSLTELYKDVKDADIEGELTADLVGDYLFSDTDFISNLSTKNRNVFQKVYDEIKYLCRVVTAGSKEARELERVRKAFEDAYREGGKAQGETKYSVSDNNIKDISTGYGYGETYYTMSYTQDGKVVATLEYGEYDGEANVKMIRVDPEYRRKGIATKLMQELQNKYPDTEINFGMSTPDGTKLLESITYDVTDEAVVADRQKLKDLQAELNELQEKLDVLYDTENLTEEQDAELHKLGDRWQEVYESIHYLAEDLRGKKATRTFVKTDTKYSLSDSDGRQLTKEQQEYFKDSKVRDAGGNLLKVYHTTNNEFTVFDKARHGEATQDSNTYLGFFFTDGPEYMKNFPEFENGKTDAYYLNVKKPIDMTNISKEAFLDIVEVMGGDVQEATDVFDEELAAEQQRAKNRGDNNTSLQLSNLLDTLTGEYYYDDFYNELKPHYEELMSRGYDGIVNYMDEMFGVKEYIVLDSNQAKLATNEKPTEGPDIRYSLTEQEAQETNEKLGNVGMQYDSNSGTVSYSLSSLEEAFDYNKGEAEYHASREEYANALAKATGKTPEEANRYLDSMFLVHDMIAADRNRLDYESAPNKSAWVSNTEYGGSIDFSTLCAKRRLFTGTFDAIQNALPDTVLNDTDFLNIRNLLLESGQESPCSMCYVEGSRAKHGVYVAKFLKEYLKTDPEWKPQIADFASTTRLEQTRIQHPEAYAEYQKAMNKLSQRKPKEASVRTDYKGEILRDFKDTSTVAEKNKNGGVRFNSFSDFEIIHAIDCMQVLTDMSRVGLNGQAYTKVKEFAEAFGNTGLKINLSLVAKDVDTNGKLVMDETNGMNYAEAMDIRNRYSENVGTVIVVFNDRQLMAALADNTIDYVLPFHRSQWKKSQYELMGLPNTTRDYTNIQNDRYKNPKTGKPKKAPNGNIMPNEYWDFTLSGRENAQKYLDYINENDYIPKFDFLLDRVDGDWVLPEGPVGDGYFKLLINFKMYNNDGVGSPQMPVLPEFNMPYIQEMLDNYVGGHKAFPVAHDVVEKFVNGKKNGDYSLSEMGEAPVRPNYRVTMGEDIALEGIAPTSEESTVVAENATTEELTAADMRELFPDDGNNPQVELDNLTARQEALEDRMLEMGESGDWSEFEAVNDEYMAVQARMQVLEAELQESESDRIGSLEDADAPPEMDAPYTGRNEVTVDDPFENRNWEDVTGTKNRSVKSFMAENPGFKPFFKAEAQAMLGELGDSQKAELLYNDQLHYDSGGEQGWMGHKRLTSRSIETLLDDWHMGWDEVQRGLEAIIAGNGAENITAAKKIEFMLNDRLLNGYTDFYTGKRVPPNQDYISFLNERQVNQQAQAQFDSFMETADMYAPEDIGPVLKKATPDTQQAPVFEGRDGQATMFEPEPETTKQITRKEYHQSIIDRIRGTFKTKGFDFDNVLKNAKNLSTWSTVDNTPQRVMEKALGYKAGGVLADITVNKVAQNESEGIKWVNRNVATLKQISRQYHIKPGSKESAAAQMYAEGFYVNKNNEIVRYGDPELIQDFKNPEVRRNIKGLARDPRIRKIYDDTLASINESRTRNLYPEIPRLDNYFLHFRAMTDTFSTLGLPFNPNDIRAKDLPTDLNGVTADLKPGQPYFASAMHREGKRTSFDLLGGVERYLNSAKNQIYHIDDIQTLRALRNHIAETYGQATGLEDIDSLSDAEAEERIKQVYGAHLSTFAKFLNEEANVLAGKTALIDRGLEGIIGRRGITFLNTLNQQVGSNMVGYNVSSSLTNFLPVAQAFAKTNKFDFVKAFAQTAANKVSGGRLDSFAEDSPVVIRRKGQDRFYQTPWQKMQNPGYALMGMVDDISTELIARTKYNELTRKGMDSQKAHFETDKWVSRLMGDRSLGQMPQLYNSKMLGLITKFQLEVRNQLDAQFYDTIQEKKVSNEHIRNGLARNARTAAQVASTFAQLAVVQHLFGMAFESVAGYNPAFDIIEVLMTAFGYDDEEDSEDTALDNFAQGLLALAEDMPYASTFTGGRVPISEAIPDVNAILRGEDEYGNEIGIPKAIVENAKEIAPYYLLPGGFGQAKKTVAGLKMFSDEHPIAGSYTDAGNLRFPVEDTLKNRIHAGIFGQYANENARKYFDQEQRTLNPDQTAIFAELDMPIEDYWEYRDNLYAFYDAKDQLEEAAEADGATDEDVLKSRYAKSVYSDINKLYSQQKEIAGGNSLLKQEQLRDIQSQMEKMLSESKSAVDNISVSGAYAEVGDRRYNYDAEEDTWYEIKPKNADGSDNYYYQQEQEITKKFGISYSEYWNNRDEYSFAYSHPKEYALAKAIGGYDAYADHYDALENWKSDSYIASDKDKYGDSISGSRKKKVQAYIDGLDISDIDKILLFKSVYTSYDDYNSEIIDYLNSRKDLSYEEKEFILVKLGAKVDSEGYIEW